MIWNVSLRREIRPEDMKPLEEILVSSGFFSSPEVAIGKELLAEALENGPASGYFFIFADAGKETAAYACYGPDDGNPRKFHLYWIAVHENFRGHGLGSMLIEAAEHDCWAAGADMIAVETSSRAQYAPSRAFYEGHGYVRKEARRNHYGPGDHLLIYIKTFGESEFPAPTDDQSPWDHADT